jgi:hypothetical protein
MKSFCKQVSIFLTLVCGVTVQAAQANWLESTTITPIVGVNLSNLDYRRAAATDNRRTTLNSLSIALGVSRNKWFGRISAELPMAPGTYIGGSQVIDMKRTDFSLSGGYAVTPRISVYTGYLLTQIELHSSAFLENQDDAGIFVGGSLELFRGKNSSLSANIAYAQLNGTAKRITAPSTVSFDVSGPTTGLSYGLSWTGQLGKNGRSYTLGYKVQDFRFDGSGTGGPQTVDKKYSVLTISMIL